MLVFDPTARFTFHTWPGWFLMRRVALWFNQDLAGLRRRELKQQWVENGCCLKTKSFGFEML